MSFKKKLLSIILILAVSNILVGWTANNDYAISGKEGYEIFYSSCQTSQGGLLLAGESKKFGTNDLDGYVVKINPNGNQEWTKTFGGNQDDSFNLVKETSDGGYILVGDISRSSNEYYNGYVVKINAEGKEEWAQDFHKEIEDKFNSIHETNDGSFVLIGSIGHNASSGYIVKVDKEEEKIWSNTIEEEEDVSVQSSQKTSDGGFLLAGYINVNPEQNEDLNKNSMQQNNNNNKLRSNFDGYIIKVDNEGEKEWSKSFGGEEYDGFTSIQKTSDGGFILTGITKSFKEGVYDGYAVKIDAEGNEEWSKAFGDRKRDKLYSAQETSDGGFLLAGVTEAVETGTFDGYVVKVDRDGNKEWSKSYGGQKHDGVLSIQPGMGDEFILSGYTASFGTADSIDGYLLKIDSDGTPKTLP